jgi:ribosomal protein S18 acetylase RimI-like enzyme
VAFVLFASIHESQNIQAMLRIVQASSPEDFDSARALFRAYAESLGVDLSFQNFSEELRELPGAYIPPRGRLLLAFEGSVAIGCGALRDLGEGICEMKRLYVDPQLRGKKAGRALAEALIAAAREIGYRAMRLDTLAPMTEAQSLYRSLGFREIAPYRYNPLPGTHFLELRFDEP